MSGVDHLHELFGLPAVDFQHASGEAPVQAADAAAWRISVDPYDDESEMTWEEAFKAFLDTVDPAGVRALIVGQWGEAYEVKSSYAIDLIIAAADRLTSLEAVFIGDMTSEENEISWIEQSDVTALLNAFPGLLELGVRGGTDLVFSPSKHERLRSLTIETGGLPVDVIRGILDSELPALERLDLWLGVSAYGGDADVADLAPLLSGTRFPGSPISVCATARCRTRSRRPWPPPRSSRNCASSTCRTAPWATRARRRCWTASRSPISKSSTCTTTS